MVQSSLLEQFDQAKPGRFHFWMITLIGACWMLGAYGLTIVGFLLPSLEAEWQVTTGELGIIASLSMAGMFVGSIVAGTLADHFGRKLVLTVGLGFMGIIFLCSALSPSMNVLLVFRFLTGFGFGAILPVSSTYVSEFSPSKQRGAMTVLLNACWGLGGVVSALVGYLLVLRYGWRPALALGGICTLLTPIIWKTLPESIRFLLSRDRVEQAYKEVERIHLEAGPAVSSDPITEPIKNGNGSSQKVNIFAGRYMRITFILWILWTSLNFLYQGAYIWLPTLLHSVKIAEGRSFLLTLFISLGQLPGTFLVAYLADRISRRKLIITSIALLSAAAFLLGLSQHDAWILIVGFLLMVFNGMAWGIAYPFSTEMYPTSTRGAATGWATGVGRLGGVIAPLVVAFVLNQSGSLALVFSVLAIAPLLSAVLLNQISVEGSGKSLEEIA